MLAPPPSAGQQTEKVPARAKRVPAVSASAPLLGCGALRERFLGGAVSCVSAPGVLLVCKGTEG